MAFAGALGVAAAVAGATADLEIVVPEGAVSVGDRMQIRVVGRGDDSMLWGDLQVAAQRGGPWEIVDGPRPIAGSSPPAWELIAVPMEVGEIELPAFETAVRAAGAAPVAVRPSHLPVVNVATVLPPDDSAEPAPLRDPLGVGGFPWEWVLPALVVAMPLAMIGGLLWRRRRQDGPLESRPRLAPISELEELVAALGSSVGRDPAEGICDRLAGGFRRYLERRSGEPALEMTSFELRILARRSGWPESVQRAVRKVTTVVDGVRFGRLRAPDDDVRTAIETAGAAGRALETHLAVEAERELQAARKVAS